MKNSIWYLINDKYVIGLSCNKTLILSNRVKPDIERVHLKFLKQILKVKSQTPSAAVYGELGRVPLHVMRKERILKYWFKVKCSTNTLLQETYLNEIHVAEHCHYPTSMSFWTIKVKQLLDYLGLTFLWDSDDITLLQVNQIMERLYDHFLQGWFGDLNNISNYQLMNALRVSSALRTLIV